MKTTYYEISYIGCNGIHKYIKCYSDERAKNIKDNGWFKIRKIVGKQSEEI